jgi:hypothetical protein
MKSFQGNQFYVACVKNKNLHRPQKIWAFYETSNKHIERGDTQAKKNPNFLTF